MSVLSMPLNSGRINSVCQEGGRAIGNTLASLPGVNGRCACLADLISEE